jgi:sugar/nucleoside kinase (ribokinase family)
MTKVPPPGSINADFQVGVERPPQRPGTLLARDLLRTSGGKAANVAVFVRRLGVQTRLLGCVGDDDLAEQALAGPSREGVDVTLVRRTPGPTGVACIVVTGRASSYGRRGRVAWHPPARAGPPESKPVAAPHGQTGSG